MLNYHLATEVVDKQPYLPKVASVTWQTFFFVSLLGQGSESYPPLGSFSEIQAFVSDSPESESRPDHFDFYFLIYENNYSHQAFKDVTMLSTWHIVGAN